MSNIVQYKGETLILGVEIIDETQTPAVPYDITGFTAHLTVKKKKSDLDVDALISMEQSIHDDAVNGQTHFTITVGDTENMDFDDYVYDVEIRNNDLTIIRTVLVGHWEIQEKVKD